MKMEAIGDSFILNGEVKKTKGTQVFEKIEKPPIYEVIRIINGVPLFFEEHIARMKQSANIVATDLGRTIEDVRRDIIELMQANNIENENIKIILAETDEMKRDFIVYQIKSFYPPQSYYTEGIHTIFLDYERKNPNAKVLFTSFKERVKAELDSKEAFEALLVNKSGKIVEGSRSNIFFVYNDKVYTAKGGDVLLGITRSYIFKICKKLNIEIIEENIDVDDVSKIDGAFMTGTSVNVLPISTIDENRLNSIYNRIIVEINNQYIAEIENYTLKHQDKWIIDKKISKY